MSKVRSRLPPSFSTTVGTYANLDGSLRKIVLAPSEFFAEMRKALKKQLPAARRDFRTTRQGRLMKLHFGEPAFHYEAWHHAGIGRLEVGLHFEASAVENQAAFDFFRSRMVEVKAGLPRAELEPWDRGWSRLYETVPAARLDDDVVILQPMLEQFLRSRER